MTWRHLFLLSALAAPNLAACRAPQAKPPGELCEGAQVTPLGRNLWTYLGLESGKIAHLCQAVAATCERSNEHVFLAAGNNGYEVEFSLGGFASWTLNYAPSGRLIGHSSSGEQGAGKSYGQPPVLEGATRCRICGTSEEGEIEPPPCEQFTKKKGAASTTDGA